MAYRGFPDRWKLNLITALLRDNASDWWYTLLDARSRRGKWNEMRIQDSDLLRLPHVHAEQCEIGECRRRSAPLHHPTGPSTAVAGSCGRQLMKCLRYSKTSVAEAAAKRRVHHQQLAVNCSYCGGMHTVLQSSWNHVIRHLCRSTVRNGDVPDHLVFRRPEISQLRDMGPNSGLGRGVWFLGQLIKTLKFEPKKKLISATANDNSCGYCSSS